MAATALVRHDGGEALGLVAPPDLRIESEAFTGTLGSLFKLVREHRIELAGVPLAPLCESYWRYVVECSGEDFEAAAVALVALAYLVERKAFGMLPSEAPGPEEADDPAAREPWVAEFADAIAALTGRLEDRERLFFRASEPGGEYELPFEVGGVSPSDLAHAFARLLERAEPSAPESVRKPGRSLGEVVALLEASLTDAYAPFAAMLPDRYTRADCVWWFLALLELMRLGRAEVRVAGAEAQARRRPGRG
jgi:segregation and condensation protein A